MTTKVKSKVTTNVLSDEVIDIPGSTLLEWLIGRNKVKQHWKRNHPKLLKLIEEAQQLDTSQKDKELNYFECQRIFKENESEAGSTTLFGSYSNPKTQKWYEVVSQYEKDYLYLGESCQIFTQNINYEIPDLKKTVEKSSKNLDDFSKREVDLNKSKSSAMNAYKKSCQDLGIKGENIREEIESLPLQLKPLYEEIIQILQSNESIVKGIDFYKDILKQTKSEFDNLSIMPLTLFLVKYGNLTLLERERILNPSSDLPDLDSTLKTSKNITVEDDTSANKASDKIEIDWCMDDGVIHDITTVEESNGNSNVIVWEDGMDVNSPTIQWDDFSMDTIELVEDDQVKNNSITTSNNNNNNNNNDKKKKDKKSATVDIKRLSSESILSDSQLRNQFLDEIFEIELFLQYRITEMEKSNSLFGIDFISSESSVAAPELKLSLTSFQEILKKLSNNRIKQIIEIKSSKKYVDRLVLQFSQKQSNISKFTNQLVDLDRKREDLNETLVESKKKLDQITLDTKQLKSKLESLLSQKLFDKKKVNIIFKL
ncbi:DUF733 family protein [Tieghemostelium lacteum]|uniref:DUF733 family protein n=1 Tax=Tieghemostelium lacteum TaxID=361077 RepID=A0A151ZKN9_TIELA|nr:DUF733 family protein [Tieghemostelium lacteum]|eukprot:KYQ94364.1 DUF733 family protein [Tieghemostelium lacteum]